MSALFADRLYNAFERNDPDPGTLLIAAPDMMDPNFVRSAVLIIENNEYTTVGVDLTRFTDVAIANALPELNDACAAPKALFIGGPVEQTSINAIGVAKTGLDKLDDRPHFRHLGSRMVHIDINVPLDHWAHEIEGMRIFAGYAEWEPGQLDAEIERGDWFVAPALPSDIIAGRNADVWGSALRRQQGVLSVFSTFPADLDMN